MTFNDILVETGGFGLYQKLLTFGCLAYSLIVVSITYWVQVYILLIPPHRCKVFPNDTEWNSFINITQNVDQCHLTDENGILTECNYGMIYDFSEKYPTYASEHDLVCENSWKVYVTHTVYWIGTILGTIVYGTINDNYGRRRAYQCAVSLSLAADITTYFCTNHVPFVIARFFSAAGVGSIATIAFVLAVEHSIPSKRRMMIFVWSFAYALTSLAITWLVYAVSNWKYILLFSWLPTSGAIIMSYFFPESPSWLVTRGRIEEAVGYIQRMAKVNGRHISKEKILHHLQIDAVVNQKDSNCIKKNSSFSEKEDLEREKSMTCFVTLVAVLKSPNLRKRILCLGFLWFAACACYNGNNLEFHFLPFNMYITYSVGALIEIPGNLFVIMMLDKLGRRWTNAGFFILGGILGILGAIVTQQSLMMVFVMMMRCCYASAYDITFSFSSELLPTEIRGRAISFIRTLGGIGSASAPFVVKMAEKDPLLPLILFGILGVVSGLAMLTLPETTDKHLPQTIEEGEKFETDQSFWFFPFVKTYVENENESSNQKSLFGPLSNPAFETDEEQVKCVGINELPKY